MLKKVKIDFELPKLILAEEKLDLLLRWVEKFTLYFYSKLDFEKKIPKHKSRYFKINFTRNQFYKIMLIQNQFYRR